TMGYYPPSSGAYGQRNPARELNASLSGNQGYYNPYNTRGYNIYNNQVPYPNGQYTSLQGYSPNGPVMYPTSGPQRNNPFGNGTSFNYSENQRQDLSAYNYLSNSPSYTQRNSNQNNNQNPRQSSNPKSTESSPPPQEYRPNFQPPPKY